MLVEKLFVIVEDSYSGSLSKSPNICITLVIHISERILVMVHYLAEFALNTLGVFGTIQFLTNLLSHFPHPSLHIPC